MLRAIPSGPVKAPADFSTLKALLEEQETFPMVYLHKFVGRNTPAFALAVAELERNFPGARREKMRASPNQGHLALTYEFSAASADEIIELLRATHLMIDVLVIL